jgi:hypothetical protein
VVPADPGPAYRDPNLPLEPISPDLDRNSLFYRRWDRGLFPLVVADRS